jgi:hypothetical protein
MTLLHLPFRRRSLGSCATCDATVFGDEAHMTLHGVLVHRRCVAYRRRRSVSGG